MASSLAARQGRWIRGRLKTAQSVFHRAATTCGERHQKGWSERKLELAFWLLIDGRHLGCGGSRSSSRRVGRGGPWPKSCRPARAGRHLLPGLSYAFRASACAEVAQVAGLAKAGRAQARMDLRFRVCSRNQVREAKSLIASFFAGWRLVLGLLPAPRWFCDRRCSSESGWGEASSSAFEQ